MMIFTVLSNGCTITFRYGMIVVQNVDAEKPLMPIELDTTDELDITEEAILQNTREVLQELSKLNLTDPNAAIRFTMPMDQLQQRIIKHIKNGDHQREIGADDLIPELLNYFIKAGFRKKHLNEVDRLIRQFQKVSDPNSESGRKTLRFQKPVPLKAPVNLSFNESRISLKTKKPLSTLYTGQIGYTITNILTSLEYLKPLGSLFEFKAILDEGIQSIHKKITSSGNSTHLRSLQYHLQSISSDIQIMLIQEGNGDLSEINYNDEIQEYHQQLNKTIASYKLSGIDYILKRIELEIRNLLRATFNVKFNTANLLDELHTADTANSIKTFLKPIK